MTPQENGLRRGLVVLDSLRHRHLGMNRSLLLAAPHLQAAGIALTFVGARSALHAARDLLQAGPRRFDFLLLNSVAAVGPRAPFGYRLWQLLQRRLPVYVYWHETDWVLDRLAQTQPAAARRLERIARQPRTRQLAASAACAAAVRRRYGGGRVTPIYECAAEPPPGEPPLPAEPPLVVNVASLQPRKGPDLFVETAVAVCQQHPDARFAWIGGGEVDGRLQQRIQAAGLAQRIEFTGYLEAPHTLLRQASCLFLTSRDDPFPLSVLEAMSLARSVITFDVGGAPEALAGSGIVLPPFDTAAAAEAILELLRQPAAARLRPAARARYLAEYTPQRFAARLAPLLLGEIDDE